MALKNITLVKTEIEDLQSFFEFQLDDEANWLAAFTAKDPTDKVAYIEKYSKFVYDPTINSQTIKVNDVIVGSIAKFIMHNEAGIGYWIDKQFWGQGIATAALQAFLRLETTRPIHAYVAFDNDRSQKVLEKCGFEKVGTDKGFANARNAEIEEYIYRLSE